MKIHKLEPSKRVEGRWLAFLEDGTILRLSGREVVDFALYTGMELEGETLEALMSAAGESAARDKALSLTSARPYSRGELERRLRQGGIEPRAAAAAADWMAEIGLIDDARYAVTVAEHYAAKGCGERKIRYELQRRLVPREYWEDALAELEDPAEQLDELVRKKLAGKQPDRRELKRVSDALARRGYSWSDISEALRRYGAQIEN